MVKRKRFTLMPIIALASLSLMVSLPMLSGTLHAAGVQHFTNITVRPGDTLWSIAARHAGEAGDVQATIDRISEANHLSAAELQPGEHLRIPN
ncbi:MAG: LysM peptidoglycan-binding domain-containing protein [Candidatus Baltobacteraceae bacterium]